MRKHRWWNHGMIYRISEPSWESASTARVHDRVILEAGSSLILAGNAAPLINMSSYSYLGLDEDERILIGAESGLRRAHVLNSSLSRIRMRLKLLDDIEEGLSELFSAETGTTASCSAAAWSILPLIASGLLTGGRPPLVVFDANAHFCLQALKAACADETEVVTIRHNDIERLQKLCREHDTVVYVADSVYSTGGTTAPMRELMDLQQQFGLYLFFDEAHGTSVAGDKGQGYALQAMGEMRDRTFVVTSLNKGFGASGGAILFGSRGRTASKLKELVARHGGPFLWSQRINSAGLGAIEASIAIHQSAELSVLQNRLAANISLFDSLIKGTSGAGTQLPVRFIRLGDEVRAIEIAAALQGEGFYVEPDFFPVVSRAEAGIRVRLRANMLSSQITEFATRLEALMANSS